MWDQTLSQPRLRRKIRTHVLLWTAFKIAPPATEIGPGELKVLFVQVSECRSNETFQADSRLTYMLYSTSVRLSPLNRNNLSVQYSLFLALSVLKAILSTLQ